MSGIKLPPKTNQLAEYLGKYFSQGSSVGGFLTETDIPLWAMTRLGFEGLMLDRVQRQLRASELQSDIAMKGNTDGIDTLYPTEDENMGVSVGNTYNINVSQPQPDPVLTPVPPAVPSPDPVQNNTTTTTTERTINPVLPYVLAGILGLGGLGAGYFLNKPKAPVPPPVPVVDTDTDTNSVTDVVFPQ